MMRPGSIVALTVILGLFLTGCAVPSAVIRAQTLSYDDVIEDATNKLLVLNVLRAKDKAPLDFAEIPSIHESIQATASAQASWVFGHAGALTSQTRNTVTPGLSIQVIPTFEVDHLDTKDFVTGIASRIDPKFIKYWLDRGLDRRIVMLLFFSAATITETTTANGRKSVQMIRLMNSPRTALDSLEQQRQAVEQGAPLPDNSPLRCDILSDFQHYLKLINALPPFFPEYYKKPPQLVMTVPVQSPSILKSLQGLDPAKYQLVAHPKDNPSTLDVYVTSSESQTTLCPIPTGPDSPKKGNCIELEVQAIQKDHVPLPSPPIERRSQPSAYCRLLDGVVAGKGIEDESNPSADVTIEFDLRSAGEMIQFLGDLLEYQEELPGWSSRIPPEQLKLNNPLTFGYCPDDVAGSGTGGCGDVFFNLPARTCNARFSVVYRGRTYAVPNYNASPNESCESGRSGTQGTERRDHTLEVLAVLRQMVDLQKSAQDIRETPYVQVLP